LPDDVEEKPPVRDARHHALGILIGKWINQGHIITTADVSPAEILASDVYEWVPRRVDACLSTFYDSFGYVHTSRILRPEGPDVYELLHATR
jgi:hypothetical protein